MSEKDLVLDLKNLNVKFVTEDATVYAINGLNMELERGKAIGLVGETGAGKTTTALSLLRLVQSPPGVVECDKMEVNGKDVLTMGIKDLESMRGKDISMIFQDPMTALNPVFTVGEQIAESVFLHENCTKEEANQRAIEMLELVGIPGERAGEYPHQFSGGMKQRVVIAIALACHPQLLIADEPTTALDVTIQAQVLDIINQLREQYKMAMVLITHDLGVVAETCDNVAIMYAGQIVEAGTVREVYLNPKHPYTRGLFDSIPKLDDDSTELIPIEGAISNAADLPTGCYFHPRCRYCQDICKTQQPTVKGDHHKFMCHFDLFSKEEEK